MLWLLKYQDMLTAWLEAATDDQERLELAGLLPSILPAQLPQIVPGMSCPLQYSDALDLQWGLYCQPGQPDRSAVISRVRGWLGLEDSGIGGVSVRDIVDRIERYLRAHPYVDVLHLNIVQPGAAQLILDALLELQSRGAYADLRYVVRLFATQPARELLGSAFDDFMSDPEEGRRYQRDAADAFLSSTDDPITPKLAYSKHDVTDLVERPSEFPAHVSLLVDWFGLQAVATTPPRDVSSSFGEGLIVEPTVVFRQGDLSRSPLWDEVVVARPNASEPLEVALAATQAATATHLRSDSVGMVPAVRLELDAVTRSILSAVHRSSDWVVTIDPVFGDEYFDSPPPDRERTEEASNTAYLIDYTGSGRFENSRRVLVSTRAKEELRSLLDPA
jgi:hypothetical protein